MSDNQIFKIYKENVDTLIAKYPHLFNKEFPVPLSVGIHKAIMKETGMSYSKLGCVLTVWCSRLEYTMMCLSGGSREDTKGCLRLIKDAQLNGFIAKFRVSSQKRKYKSRIRQFALDYKEKMGRPAFLCLPMSSRIDLGKF